MRLLIVGQAPSRTSDAREPLSGRSGKRLASLCGLSIEEFVDRFERVNVVEHPCPDGWPVEEARERGAEILLRYFKGGRRIVLLGPLVIGAIMAPSPGRDDLLRFRLRWFGGQVRFGFEVAHHPHPSGRNRFWNDPARVEAARRFWRELA